MLPPWSKEEIVEIRERRSTSSLQPSGLNDESSCVPVQGPEGSPVSEAFMARFPLLSQLRDFAESAPVQALLGERQDMPLHVEYCVEFDVVPPQKSQDRTQDGLRTDSLN